MAQLASAESSTRAQRAGCRQGSCLPLSVHLQPCTQFTSHGRWICCRVNSSAGGAAHGEGDRSVHGPAAGGGAGGGNQFPPGADDSLASLLPSAAELGLSMAEERPNARK